MQDVSGDDPALDRSPAIGQTITFFLAPTGAHVALGPALAALCGVLASNGWQWQAERMLALLLVVFIVEGLWSTWRVLLVDIDWTARMAAAPLPKHGDALPAFPYLTPWSPVGRVIDGWGRLRRWARETLSPAQNNALMTLPYLPVLTLALSLLLGHSFLLLSLSALALAVLEWVVARRQTWHKSIQATIQIILSWMAGHLVFASLTGFSLTLACAYALSYQGALYLNDRRCTVDQHPWALGLLFGGQVFVAGALALNEHTVAAVLLGLLLVPQLLPRWQLNTAQPPADYLSRIAPFLGVAMAIAAWTI